VQGIAAISFALVLGVSLVVGIRLMLIWSRTRGMPELLLGGMLLLTAGIGYPFQIMGTQLQNAAAIPLYLLGYVGASGGVALLYVFTGRVFRGQEKWARVLVWGCIAALTVNSAMRIQEVLVSQDTRLDAGSMGKLMFQGSTVAFAFLWTAWESLRHHAMMKRRGRLGLADPALANRFLLWGSMALFSSVGTILNCVAVSMHIDVMNDPGVLFASSLSSLGQAVLLLLALMPPRWYLDYVRSRSAGGPVPQES
jgi:hypothetical protein